MTQLNEKQERIVLQARNDVFASAGLEESLDYVSELTKKASLDDNDQALYDYAVNQSLNELRNIKSASESAPTLEDYVVAQAVNDADVSFGIDNPVDYIGQVKSASFTTEHENLYGQVYAQREADIINSSPELKQKVANLRKTEVYIDSVSQDLYSVNLANEARAFEQYVLGS